MIKRKYKDKNGLNRELTLCPESMQPNWLVRWKKGAIPGFAQRWYTEDGSIISIPSNAWTEESIEYKDETTENNT